MCLLCLFSRLFICALWLPAGKGLTFWLSFVVSNSECVTLLIVSIPDFCADQSGDVLTWGRFECVFICFRFRYSKTRFWEKKINKSKLLDLSPFLRFDTETATFKVTNTLIHELLTSQIVKRNRELDGNSSF